MRDNVFTLIFYINHEDKVITLQKKKTKTTVDILTHIQQQTTSIQLSVKARTRSGVSKGLYQGPDHIWSTAFL